MFIHAALLSAARSVSRPLPAPVPDLDPSSSGGAFPVDQDEFAEEPASFDKDLAVGRPFYRQLAARFPLIKSVCVQNCMVRHST